MITTRRQILQALAATSLTPVHRALAVGQPTAAPTATGAPAERLIVLSIDGVRTQEMFGGLDRSLLQAQLGKRPVEEHAFFKRYWRGTPQARREALMPFFWTTLMRAHGSIVGDQSAGSVMRLGNAHRFSYPGYAELMLGVAHDAEIDSNDNRRYPHDTVLQFLRRQLGASREQVACFGSWEVFQSIPASRDGEVFEQAGFMPYEVDDEGMRRLSGVQSEARAFESARLDAFTWHFARDHLARARPRVLWIALNDTDEWAHQREYTRVIDHLHRFDGWLSQLWTWTQGDAGDHGRTAVVIVTDHGRGVTADDWGDHGKDVEGAQDVWAAFAVPAWKARGVWRAGHPPASQSQIAATLAAIMGHDWRTAAPQAGAPLVPPV